MYWQQLQKLCTLLFLVDAVLTLSDQIMKDVENPFLSAESANSFLNPQVRNKRGCPYESIREHCLTICDYLPPNCVKRSISDNSMAGLGKNTALNKYGLVSTKLRKGSIAKIHTLLNRIEQRLRSSAREQRQRNSRHRVYLQQKSILLNLLQRSNRFIAAVKSRRGSESYR